MCSETVAAVSEQAVPPPPLYKDRSSALFLFGVLDILLGLLSALLFVGLVLLQLFLRTEGMAEAMGQPASNMAGALFYLFIAVFFIGVGVGTIRARRWARALMLTVSSIWLAIGVLSLISMSLIMPGMMKGMTNEMAAGEDALPPQFMTIFLAAMMVFMFCFYVLIPGVFVLFYRSRHVKATCEARSPAPCWTDRCPLPVLAVSLVCGFGGAVTLLMAPISPVLPFLDRVLTGPPAGALLVAMAVVLFLLAWGTFRLRMAAWWGCIALLLFGGGFGVATFTRIDIGEFYWAMGYPQEQIKMIEAMGMPEMMASPAMLALLIGTMVLYTGYLVYVRRFFPKPV